MTRKWSTSLLLDLYKTMQTIRLCEESLVSPISEGLIKCPVHLYVGQEAIAAGVCRALTDADYIFSNHRSHGHYLAKGGTLETLLAEIYCREAGCSRGRGGSMHLVDPEKGILGSAPIVGGTISLALGAALAAHIRRDSRIVVSFFGDGATGEGVLYEAMNFAALKKLPMIFACENNLYSTHMPIRDIRVNNPIADIASPFGITAQRIDGNDVLRVYEAATQAVEACRAGRGPTFIEFLTYRMRGHVGPNDNIQGTQTDIRPTEEVEHWRERDPIERLDTFIASHGGIERHELDAIKKSLMCHVEAAHAAAQGSPRPAGVEMERYVFYS